MTSLLPNEMRLADLVLEDSKKSSFFVEGQFPAVYRENGQELIELVKAYYRFLEQETNQSIYNSRRMYSYRNIDSTLENMLLFFKNKFLNGLFFQQDTRFIVKHILDLYRRKGSKEGIELFFKMFFDSEVDVYYPSQDMFKPSESKWIVGKYIQLFSVSDTTVFTDIINKQIFGSVSNASAFVDNLYFVNIGGSITPILFLSNVKGSFVGFDVIYSRDPEVSYGTVYGSIQNTVVEPEETSSFTGSNRVGDSIDIVSADTGFGAKGRVTKITEDLSGEITFRIRDGGYGYTISANTNPISETQILVSQQSIFLNNPDRDFILEETVKQINSSNTEVFGTIIGQKTDSIGVVLIEPESHDSNTYFFEAGYDIETTDRIENITREVIFTTSLNTSSSLGVGSIENTETITLVTDMIEDFLDVPLDSLNYSVANTATAEMSGTILYGIEPNANTALNEAFVPSTFEIGQIATLSNIDPGFDYNSDVFVLARETLFKRFDLKNQILKISGTGGISLFEGDIITQERELQDFYGFPITVTVKGEIVKIEGDNLYIKQLSFDSFAEDEPIFKQGSTIPITVVSRSRDNDSVPLGLNANIEGNVDFISGKIERVAIVDSGIGYKDKEVVKYVNTDKKARLEQDLASYLAYQSEFDTLEAEFGYSDETEVVVKRWDLADVAAAILSAGFAEEPEKTLFFDTFVPSTSKRLGDVDQNDSFAFEDYSALVNYINNYDDAGWRSTNSTIVSYVEGVMFNFMEDNFSDYSDYALFSETDYFRKKNRLDFLFGKNFEENIADIQAELTKVNTIGDGYGIVNVRGQGLTEGRWVTFESHINQEKVIQDSLFYQDYSYEISTEVSPIVFEDIFKDIAHPAGIKMFSKFAKSDIINTQSTIEIRIESDLETEIDTSEDLFVANTGFQYTVIEEE